MPPIGYYGAKTRLAAMSSSSTAALAKIRDVLAAFDGQATRYALAAFALGQLIAAGILPQHLACRSAA